MTYESPAEVTLMQGSYWKPREDVIVEDILDASDGLDTDRPIVIPAGTVMLLQSIRDVDNTAHTIILRPHPAVYGMSVYTVSTKHSSFSERSWTHSSLTEFRFLVADFLTRFTPAFDFEQIRAKELADAQEHVRQLQLKLTEGQNNPDVMRPVLMLGVGEWEKEKGLDPEKAAYIASMPAGTAMEPGLTGEHVEDLKLKVDREHRIATVRATWIKERVADVGTAIKALMPYMEEQAAAALSQTEDIIRKVGGLMKGIQSLDLYIGKDVEVETLSTGKSAPADEPLTIAQRKLYMQEEFSVWANVTEEFDYGNDSQFLKALVENPSLQRQIFPADRCIVCMATRRENKEYGDVFANVGKNEINRQVFLLVKDGENLHRVFSPVESHLRSLQLFPSRSETNKVFSGSDGENVNFMDTRYTDKLTEHEELALHYKRFLILLAGLDHRLNLFGNFYEGAKTTKFVSLEFQLEHFRFIHDADGEGMLPTEHKLSLGDWLKLNNSYLRSGSRVMCIWHVLANPKTAPGMAKPNEKSHSGYYYYRHSQNETDVAIAHESQGELVVNCNTTSSAWRSDGTRVVASRVSLNPKYVNYYKGGMGYIVLDAIKADELDWYIHDRDSRVSHLEYITLFKDTLAHLREVEKQESSARLALRGSLEAGGIGKPEQRGEIVDLAVRSWRACNRGAELPKETSGTAWNELLNTMYTIANGDNLIGKALDLCDQMQEAPLRLTVTGSNKLVLYTGPREEERDDRFTPHTWVHKVSIEVKRKGEFKVITKKWVILPAVSASETTLKEWPEASVWAGLTNPFPSFEEKQRLITLTTGTDVIESPWLKETVTASEWDGMLDEWNDAYIRNNKGGSRVTDASIQFPIGLSIHDDKKTVHVIAMRGSTPETRLWNLATEAQRQVLIKRFCSVWRYHSTAIERLRDGATGVGEMHFVTVAEFDRFPKNDIEWNSVSLMDPKGWGGMYPEKEHSLDYRFSRAVVYANRYKARYDVPFLHYYLNPLLEGKLDAVFGHYTGPLVTPPPPPEKENEEKDEA